MVSRNALAHGKRLGLMLLVALMLRVVILATTSPLGPQIVDEQHYHVLATSLVEGRGLATSSGSTSLRPPLYPALVAGLWSVTGSRSLQAVRAVQMLLGVATAALIFWIGRRVYDDRAALVAAAIVAFYPALLFANALLLTETLFAFLLTAFVATLISLVQRPRPVVALSVGLLLGLSALTRSVVWPVVFVLVPLLAWKLPAPLARRAACCGLLLAGYAALVVPWAVRNTRLQGVPVVIDTIGGMNLRMGNYEFTPHDRIWDAVSEQGARSWIVGLPPSPPGGGEWTEGWKERWARDQAVAFMRQHPGLTLWRAVIKFGDFWALDRDYAAGLQRGMYRPPVWIAAAVVAAMTVAFPVVLILAILGASLTPPTDWRSHLLVIGLVLFVTALHTVVFGHPRYRLPLTPLLAVYAGGAVSARGWRRLRDGWRVAWLPVTLVGICVAIWVTQFVVRDWPFVQRLLGRPE